MNPRIAMATELTARIYTAWPARRVEACELKVVPPICWKHCDFARFKFSAGMGLLNCVPCDTAAMSGRACHVHHHHYISESESNHPCDARTAGWHVEHVLHITIQEVRHTKSK
jgi:hypothetical protein